MEGLHHLRCSLVVGETLFLGLLLRGKHQLVVGGHHLGEPAYGVGPVGQQSLGHRRPGLLVVPAYQLCKLFGDGTLAWRELDQLVVDPLLVEVDYERDTTGHARGEVPPDRPEDDHATTGHVLTAVVSHALDHRGRTGVPDAEPLPDLTAQVDLTGGGAVRDHVAGDDLVLRLEHRRTVRAYDDPSTRQALADVVVGITLQAKRHPSGDERAEGLAGRPGDRDVDRAVGQPVAAVSLGDLVTQDGAHGAVDVANLHLGADRFTLVQGVARELDQLVVERLVERVVLGGRVVQRR